MAIDPNLLVIKPINEIQTASDPLSGQALIYDGGNELKKASLQSIKDSVSSGIVGEAITTTVPTPWTSGDPDLYEKYDVKTAGTFTSFKDSNNASIVVTSSDLEDNLVQFWVQNGVTQKVIKELPDGIGSNEINQIITDRFGVDIVDPGNLPIVLTKTDADFNNRVLKSNNTTIVVPATTNFVIHNKDLNDAYEIVVSGYILKESASNNVGILGIKQDGSIVDLTSGYSDYQQLSNVVFDMTDFVKFSSCMADGFSITLNFNSTYNPDFSEYFVVKNGISEIKQRIQNRYVSTYQGTTVIGADWEVSPFIKVKAGDEITGKTYSRLDAYSYATFDNNLKFKEGVFLATAHDQLTEFDFKTKDDGYIVFGNHNSLGEMEIFLNKTDEISDKNFEINQKIPSVIPKKLDAGTPRNLAGAKFYEPYIDGDVLKVKTPQTLVEKMVLNDEDHRIENRFLGEPTFVYFKGRILLYHSEAYQKQNGSWIGFMSVGEIGEESEKYTYLQKILGEGMQGIQDGYSVHRSCALVVGNQVWLYATVENDVSDSQVWLFKSNDGFNFTFTKVIMTSGAGSPSGFLRFGHMWVVPTQVNGYYYGYYDGYTTPSGTWMMKVARATTLDGNWLYFADVTGAGIGGMRGGTWACVHNNKFRVYYHYGTEIATPNLPTVLGYAEAELSAPQTLSGHRYLLGLENSPIGNGTDQNGDQALLEINGSIWWTYQYAINTPILNGVLCYKKLKGLTYDKLFN